MRALVVVAAIVVLLVVVVGVHELGHLLAAKASGIRVDEFAIGFGPRLVQRRRGETVYSIRALPLGGFVRMPGMSVLEEDDGGERGFIRAPAWRQTVVILAGVVANFLLAAVIFGILLIPGQSSGVQASGPLTAAGMHDGDVIVAVDGRPLDTSDVAAQSDALHAATDRSRGGPLSITYRRAADGQLVTTTVTPYLVLVDNDASQPLHLADGTEYQTAARGAVMVETINGGRADAAALAAALASGQPIAVAGIEQADASTAVSGKVSSISVVSVPGGVGTVEAAWRIGYIAGHDGHSVAYALTRGFLDIPSRIGAQFKGIYDIVTTPNSGGIKNFQGPVGIARDTVTVTDNGWLTFLEFIGAISLALGIVNVLPVPPFDGGRLVIILAGVLSRRRLPARAELAFVTLGVLAILTLFLLITINDIKPA